MKTLKEQYKEILPELKEKLGRKNIFSVPRIVKVTVNTGFNPASRDENAQNEIAKDLMTITGQKPVVRQAKKAEAGFKIRQGMPVGLSVTLRGDRMYDLLGRLVHIALPRGRDFRGLSETSIDQFGNLNIGLKEHIIFPEISAEHAKNIFGFQITATTTAESHEEGLIFFKLLGFPFKKSKK